MKNQKKAASLTHPIRYAFTILNTLVLLLSASLVQAAIGYKDGFDKAILMGHSFFRPGTEDLETLAPHMGYLRHNQYRHMAGGENGDPGSLWRDIGEDEGAKAEIKLGGVELLALTSFSEHDGDSDYEDYVTWIDFTLQYNAESLDTVALMIPWDSYILYPNYADYRARIDEANQLMHTLVQQLRNAYPELTIIAIPVAEAMARLWKLFDDGELGPEVKGVWRDGDADYMQKDNRGHAGYVLEDAIGLIWQQTIYPETDIRTLQNTPTYQKNWTYDLRQLAREIWEDDSYAHRYNDDAINPAPPEFNASPIIENEATIATSYTGSTLADNAFDDNGDTLTFAKISGPSWLTVSTSGALSGTPTISDAGLNSFVVSVSDGDFAAVEGTLEIAVQDYNANNNPPVFSSSSLTRTDATVGQAYNDTIAGSATDVDGDPLSYSKVSGAEWLNVDSDGTLSGTPNAAYIGDSVVTVAVNDGDGGSDTATLTVKVIEPPVNNVLINDDMESFNSTGWVTDWKDNTGRSYSGESALKANQSSNDLVSPELDTSAMSTLTLSFKYYNLRVDANDDVSLMLWNGSSYISVEEIGDNGNGAWLEYNGTISQAQYPQFFRSDFKFKIEATSLDFREAVWVDDVLLTAD